jgi:glycerol-3-phosphate dehydrogenase
MEEDVLEIAAHKAGLEERECKTRSLPIHGYRENADFKADLYYYGSDEEQVRSLTRGNPALLEPIHSKLPYVRAEITWAVRNEMCMTVEDFLARRTRALFLDARSAIEAAPLVAELMSRELSKATSWINNQTEAFNITAKNYLPSRILS